MSTPFDLDNKTAIITGAGRGIGRAIARTLAHAGANIGVAEFDKEGGQDAVNELETLGVNAHFIQTDVRDSASVSNMVQGFKEHFGSLEVMVNNAGICRNTPSEEVVDEAWLEVINVNLNGVFWCCRAAGQVMLEQGHGSIINIASMSGIVANTPQPQSAYNASKAGVILLTRSLASEWAARGVRVNSVSPGYIGTDMTKRGMDTQGWGERWLSLTPMGKLGEPSDVANAVLYLASDGASYCTGTNLVVDGGYTSQ
jgi:NAD(P)-dependent dehydrogenase (short-subunit alcohol dehydrogenase family)